MNSKKRGRDFSEKSRDRITIDKTQELSRRQEDIYTAIVNQDFENLNTIVSKYFYSLKGNDSDTIIIRKTMDVCNNDDLLKAHTKGLFNPKPLSSGRRSSSRQVREKIWPCCSLCGFPITRSDKMHIEHTIPSTLFYLLFTINFFSCDIRPAINKETFNNIMCNDFGSIKEDYRDIHLTICSSHDFCNQLKGRKVFIILRFGGDGNCFMSVNEQKIREFASGYLSPQTLPVGFMSSEIFNSKVLQTFIDPINGQSMHGIQRAEHVFNKTRTFIQNLCDKYNRENYNHASIKQNILTLKNCEIKSEIGELFLTKLDGLNLDKALHIDGFYQYLVNSGTISTDGAVIHRSHSSSGRELFYTNRSEPPNVFIRVPSRIRIIRNEIEKDFEISEYIDSLIAKFYHELERIQARGIRKNKPTKTTKNKKNKNNKTKTRNKWMNKQRSKRA